MPHLATRIAETVAAQLRERILRDPLPDGMLPKQEQLMEEFGVSAPSIREALRILETEGLITIRRGRFGGAYAHRPDSASTSYALGLALQGQQTTLEDLAQAIRTFEPLSSASCATRADRLSTVVPLLAANLEACEEALDGPDFTRLAREFHDLIVEYTQNSAVRLLVKSIVSLWSTQEETWAYNVAASGSYPDIAEQRAALNSHKKIAAQIAVGDSGAAEMQSRKHLEAAQERTILRAFRDRVVDAASPVAAQNFRRFRTSTRSNLAESGQ